MHREQHLIYDEHGKLLHRFTGEPNLGGELFALLFYVTVASLI